jgi:hypothetical protein
MNWLYVGSNAVWIVALAWGIALLGISYWESLEKKEPLHTILIQPKKLVSEYLALLLFSIGLGLVTGTTWGKVLWFILAAACAFAAWRSSRFENKKG